MAEGEIAHGHPVVPRACGPPDGIVGIGTQRAADVRVEVAVLAEPPTDDTTKWEHVTEAMVVSTCNRVEIYAAVATFHGGLTEVSGVLARHAHAVGGAAEVAKVLQKAPSNAAVSACHRP